MRKKGYGFAVSALLACALLISLFLALNGVQYSYYSQTDYSRIVLVKDSALRQSAFFVLAAAVTAALGALLGKLSPRTQERIGLGVLLFACVWFLLIGSFYVRGNPYYPEGDQLNTTAGAYYNRQGNFSMLSPGGYIGMYQQQKGLMFFYELLFSVFGDFAYGEAKQIHVLLGVVLLVSGHGFLKLHTGRALPGILFDVLLIFCMPFLLYLPYIYGDIPAICLCMAMFWALAAYGKKRKKRFLVIAALLSGAALLFRMNTWIVLIAVAIGLGLLAWKWGRWRVLLAALLIVLSAEGAVKAVDVMYEVRSGYESGIGIPSVLWIAMGLQETDGSPGVYNRYQQSVFAEYHFEREPAAQEGRNYIRGRLKELVKRPDVMADFFRRKLMMQWLEPLYESLYATKSFEEERPVPDWVEELYYGGLHDSVWKAANYYQSVVYLAFAVFVAGSLWERERGQRDGTFYIPLIAVVGGFLFSVIWESQCRYVLPYYMFLLLYAPLGLEKAADVLVSAGKRLFLLIGNRKGETR